MKTYKSSDLTHKRAEVLEEAAKNGVVIQECKTNGEVRREFVIQLKSPITDFTNACLGVFAEKKLIKGRDDENKN